MAGDGDNFPVDLGAVELAIAIAVLGFLVIEFVDTSAYPWAFWFAETVFIMGSLGAAGLYTCYLFRWLELDSRDWFEFVSHLLVYVSLHGLILLVYWVSAVEEIVRYIQAVLSVLIVAMLCFMYVHTRRRQ